MTHEIKQNGFILITVMIFSLLLTMLILSAGEVTLLQTKMVNYFFNKLVSQTAAESEAIFQEAKLSGVSLEVPEFQGQVQVEVGQPLIDNCLNENYLIDVRTNYQLAKCHLQTMYQVVSKLPPKTCEHASMSDHRIWWQTIAD